MEEGRRLAMDAPARSASELIGPHLLGRTFRPDSRDWKLSRLMEIADPPESTLQQTVEQMLEGTEYFTNWRAYLVFWRWLKRHRQPTPAKPGIGPHAKATCTIRSIAARRPNT